MISSSCRPILTAKSHLRPTFQGEGRVIESWKGCPAPCLKWLGWYFYNVAVVDFGHPTDTNWAATSTEQEPQPKKGANSFFSEAQPTCQRPMPISWNRKQHWQSRTSDPDLSTAVPNSHSTSFLPLFIVHTSAVIDTNSMSCLVATESIHLFPVLDNFHRSRQICCYLHYLRFSQKALSCWAFCFFLTITLLPLENITTPNRHMQLGSKAGFILLEDIVAVISIYFFSKVPDQEISHRSFWMGSMQIHTNALLHGGHVVHLLSLTASCPPRPSSRRPSILLHETARRTCSARVALRRSLPITGMPIVVMPMVALPITVLPILLHSLQVAGVITKEALPFTILSAVPFLDSRLSVLWWGLLGWHENTRHQNGFCVLLLVLDRNDSNQMWMVEKIFSRWQNHEGLIVLKGICVSNFSNQMCPFSRIWSSWNSKYQVLRGKSKATYKPFKNIRWYYKIQKWQKFLVELLDAKPYLHKAFRIASASTTAASANASSKESLPGASAVTFFAKSLPRQQRQLPRSMWQYWNLLIMKADMNRWFTVKQYCIPSTSCRHICKVWLLGGF